MSDLSELLQRFRHSPAVLENALDGVTAEESKFSPAPGKWTVRQIMRHLADTEIVAGMRIRQIVSEDRPTLIPFDQDKWAAGMNYNACDPHDSLRDFSVMRAATASMLAGIPADAFDREGIHPDRGTMSARAWVEIFSRHVDTHAQQILAARQAWKNR